MKKVLALILVLSTIFALSGCSARKYSTRDYQFMYDEIVDRWNAQATPGFERDSLIGFGSYVYNSYLMLFPRETPSTLTDYYFHWQATAFDVDIYAIYFTCTLTEENYKGFCEGLANFEIYNAEQTFKPIYDNEHFSLPTYLLQWLNIGQKWEVIEYIMLDDKNNTVVFVYTMDALEKIERISPYDITPSKMKFLEDDFSIYGNDPIKEAINLEECIYDISFLDYLK